MTSLGFTIRLGQPGDATAILELWREARSAHAITAGRPEDVRRLLSETPGSLLVANDLDTIVGTLIAAWDGWRGNMYRLVVAPQQRRRGIGMALVRAGEEHLRRQGARRITALVAYEDMVAGPFWDSARYPQDLEVGRRVRSL